MALRCYGQCLDKLSECAICEHHLLCEESYQLSKTDRYIGQLNEAITEAPQEVLEDGKQAEMAAELLELIEYFISNPNHWKFYKAKLMSPTKPYSELAAEAGMKSKQAYQYYLKKIVNACPIIKNSVLINKKYNSGESIFN